MGENAENNAKKLGELEESSAALQVEKERLFAELQHETERMGETEDKLAQESSEKAKLEFALNEAIEKLEGEAHSAKTFMARNNEAKKELETLNAKLDEGRELASKLEAEKSSRDNF